MRKNPAVEESQNNTQDQGRNEEIEPPESPKNLREIRVLKIHEVEDHSQSNKSS